MNDNLVELIKGLLFALALVGGGYYIKIAKAKEPHATKSLWKIIMIIGILGFIVSLAKYFIKI
ncbi:hypothetical protein [Pedobacter mucosus]|uniref:hypothetical protein n=1 Tax=Pedobacter mucosus TaxID=2895286 RepID=UPI001EE3CDE5|nr:hypothetical protein [Pedobacter mucosus]UKT64495.1 hypothetical protein LOK61_01655 [Pedobacter mucosus]